MPEEGEKMPEKEPPLLPSSVNRPDVPAGSNVPERYHGSDIVPPGLIEKKPEEIEESAKAKLQEEINRINAQRIEKRRVARERFPKKEEPTPPPQAEGPSTQTGAKTDQSKPKDEATKQKGKESAKSEGTQQKMKQNKVEMALDWIAKELDALAEHPVFVTIAGALGYDEAKELLNVLLRRSGKKATEVAKEATKKAKEKLISRKKRGKKDEKVEVETEESPEEEFEEAPQEKPEREVRPSSIPIPIIPKVEKEEKPKPEKEVGRNFIDIQEEILNFRMPPESASEEEKYIARQKLDQLLNERVEVYREVKDAGFYQDSVQQILLTLSVSKLGDVQRNIKILADSYEDRAISSEKYRNNKRWQGIVRAGIMGAAVKIAADGYSTIIDDRDALERDGMSIKGVEQLIQRAKIEHFIGFGGVNPVDYVELKYKESEGEKIYKRLREEGQGEGDSEKLKREVNELRRMVEENRKYEEPPKTKEEQLIKEEEERRKAVQPESGEGGEIVKTLEKIFGSRITKEDFLRNEKWAEYPYILDINNPPAFYKDMSNEERLNFEARVRIHHAAYLKRRGGAGFSLENVGKNNEYLNGVTNSNMDSFWRTVGVKEAMSEYLKAIENPEDKDAVKYKRSKNEKGVLTMHDCETERDANLFREEMVKKIALKIWLKIASSLLNSTTDRKHSIEEMKEYVNNNQELQKEIMNRSIIAEQIALNLHFIANTFEVRQAKWIKEGSQYIRRERQPKLNTSFFSQAPLRDEMAPMDSLLEQLFKPKASRKPIGTLTEWASYQAKLSANRVGFKFNQKNIEDNDKIDTFEIIINEEDKGKMKKCWTIEKDRKAGKFKMYVPECYPVQILGSYYEEINKDEGGVYLINEDGHLKTDDNGNYMRKDVLQAIRDEDNVDWLSVTYNWNDYVFAANRESIILEMVMGKIGVEDRQKALAKRKKQDNWDMIRWAFYTSKGVLINSRTPKIAIHKDNKFAVVKSKVFLYKDVGGLLPRDKIFFPWDDINYMKNRREVRYS